MIYLYKHNNLTIRWIAKIKRIDNYAEIKNRCLMFKLERQIGLNYAGTLSTLATVCPMIAGESTT